MRVDAPLSPSREQARAWAASELSHREYQQARPGLITRLIGWLLDHLSALSVAGQELSRLLIALVLLIVIGLVGLAIHRAGGLRRNAERQPSVGLGGRIRSADQHRDEADRLAAAGDWRAACLERFRAVARRLEEQDVLLPQPARTAAEVARDGGRWLPELGPQLVAGAVLFDGIRYGGRRAGSQADAELRLLDDAVRRARPALVDAGER